MNVIDPYSIVSKYNTNYNIMKNNKIFFKVLIKYKLVRFFF